MQSHLLLRCDRGMIEKQHTQHAVVLHGESNSGKSYNANAILNHLTAFIELHSTEQQCSRPLTLRRQVKCCSTILKSIGCARTRLTKHSTRYAGAYKLHFNSSTSQLSHISIECDLLEQGRVTGHIRGEQMYNVFHELLSAPAEFKSKLLLDGKSCDDFSITKRNSSSAKQSGTTTAADAINGASSSGIAKQTSSTYADSFITTLEAMQDIGVSKHAIHSYYSVISAILHLCEVEFRQPAVCEGSIDKSFGLDVIGEQHLQHAATLLQCDIDELSNALCYKTVSVEQKTQISSSTAYTSRRSKQRNSNSTNSSKQAYKHDDVAFTVPATEQEAWFLKNMLCKQLYTMAFGWILQQLNTELAQVTTCLSSELCINTEMYV
jgi:myosin heavy subunit